MEEFLGIFVPSTPEARQSIENAARSMNIYLIPRKGVDGEYEMWHVLDIPTVSPPQSPPPPPTIDGIPIAPALRGFLQAIPVNETIGEWAKQEAINMVYVCAEQLYNPIISGDGEVCKARAAVLLGELMMIIFKAKLSKETMPSVQRVLPIITVLLERLLK